MFDNLLPWHQDVWQRLAAYMNQDRVPHALLFSGTKGTGKDKLARRFAFSLLCSTPQEDGSYCGHCNGCKLNQAETHPDLLFVTPDETGKSISIGKIRDILIKMSLKPQYERYRVVIITPAEQMTHAAANAFLKFLEEPTERTVLLLLSVKPWNLPATIRSRCQTLALSVSDPAQVHDWLRKQGVNEKFDALFGVARGAPLLALEYAKNGYVELQKNCFAEWQAVAEGKQHPVSVAEKWIKLPQSELLLWLTEWVIVTIKFTAGNSSRKSCQPGLIRFLQNQAQRLELKKLFGLYDLLLTSRERLDSQLNNQLIFEEILIHWSKLNR
ncbi:MAG: DNA polymerase III subunit delta' [Gammaproteobacteria bacterium]